MIRIKGDASDVASIVDFGGSTTITLASGTEIYMYYVDAADINFDDFQFV